MAKHEKEEKGHMGQGLEKNGQAKQGSAKYGSSNQNERQSKMDEKVRKSSSSSENYGRTSEEDMDQDSRESNKSNKY